MGKADAIAEIAADGVADGMHIVSEEALAAEKVVRGLEGIQLAYIAMGVAIGGLAGSLISFRVAYRRAEKKFSEIAAEEIAGMRQHYLDKAVAAEQESAKGELSEIIRERGYSLETKSSDAPMAVTPPSSVVDAAREVEEALEDHAAEREDETRQAAPEEVKNIFQEAQVVYDWDWHKERSNRSPLKPYVIHIDERDEQQTYDSVTWTYFEEDDVLCRENDEVVAVDEREQMIGESNLERFGHGSNDASIVYVRNDKLEIDFEIVRSPNSYAEEVHGFRPDPEESELRHAHRRERIPETDE